MPVASPIPYAAGRWIAALALALFLLTGCAKKDEQRLLAEEARSAVLDLLANPQSATFLEEDVSMDVDSGLVCGKVSAQNDAGDVVRPQRFYFLRSIGAAIDSDRSDILFDDPSAQISTHKMSRDSLARLRLLCERFRQPDQLAPPEEYRRIH